MRPWSARVPSWSTRWGRAGHAAHVSGRPHLVAPPDPPWETLLAALCSPRCCWTTRPSAWTCGQPCRLTHMPTLRRQVAHSGTPYGPDALRLPCAWRRSFEISFRDRIPGTCPPAAGWWGVELRGKLRPSREGRSWGAFPFDLPDGAGASPRGLGGLAEPPGAAFMVCIPP